jgi:hypothetical protein
MVKLTRQFTSIQEVGKSLLAGLDIDRLRTVDFLGQKRERESRAGVEVDARPPHHGKTHHGKTHHGKTREGSER